MDEWKKEEKMTTQNKYFRQDRSHSMIQGTPASPLKGLVWTLRSGPSPQPGHPLPPTGLSQSWELGQGQATHTPRQTHDQSPLHPGRPGLAQEKLSDGGPATPQPQGTLPEAWDLMRNLWGREG